MTCKIDARAQKLNNEQRFFIKTKDTRVFIVELSVTAVDRGMGGVDLFNKCGKYVVFASMQLKLNNIYFDF